MWVGNGAKVLEVVALAKGRVDDGCVFFGGVEDDSVVVAPVVYGRL